MEYSNKVYIFATLLRNQSDMVVVVQLVRASDCGSECRGFESHQPPKKTGTMKIVPVFLFLPRKLACKREEKEKQGLMRQRSCFLDQDSPFGMDERSAVNPIP